MGEHSEASEGEGGSQGRERRGGGEEEGSLGNSFLPERQVQQQQGEGGGAGLREEAPCNSWSQLSGC